jgi:hypothetical protein
LDFNVIIGNGDFILYGLNGDGELVKREKTREMKRE